MNRVYAVFVLVFVLCAWKVSAENDVRIGISLPLSGDAVTYGRDFKNIYLFANKILANKRYTLIFEDDKCSGKDAVTVAHKLINIDRVKYVLGVTCDGVFSSAGPVYKKAGVVVISTSSSYVPGESLFHAELRNTKWPPYFYSYIKTKSKRLGILTEQSGFAQDFKKNFLKSIRPGGLEVLTEDYTTGDTDLRSSLVRFKSRGIDGLLILSQTESSLFSIVKNVEQLGLDLTVYSVFFPGSPAFLKLAGNSANGIEYLDFVDFEDYLSSSGRGYYDSYIKQFGEPSSGKGLFIRAFEAFRALHLAIQSKKNAKKFLAETTFEGIAGSWSFDDEGYWTGTQLAVKRIAQGKPKLIEY